MIHLSRPLSNDFDHLPSIYNIVLMNLSLQEQWLVNIRSMQKTNKENAKSLGRTRFFATKSYTQSYTR